MEREWKRRFTWVEWQDFESAFLKEPFPARGHRGNLGELKDSIARFGIIQPIIARVTCGRLQVVCGYRRLLAAQVAGVDRIPVIVTRLSDAGAERLFAEENSRRWGRVSNESDAVAPSARDAGVVPPATLEPAVSGRGRTLLATVDDLVETTTAVFERVGRQRQIPPREVEALLARIVDIDPVGRGLDVREVGERLPVGRSGGVARSIATHSLRVSFLALHMARSMQWSANAVSSLSLAALLHDVGMLAIPVDCVQSALPLTRSDRREIERHTLAGREMVVAHWPDAIADVARDHHERWDGTGYPTGRRGGETVLGARLVGLLDAYAAMICPRPYRPSYLITEACRTLREGGKIGIFDPTLVDRFHDVFTLCPIGMRGRLPDGTVVRVRGTGRGEESAHALEVEGDPQSRATAAVVRIPSCEIDGRLTEIPLGPEPARSAATAFADAFADVP